MPFLGTIVNFIGVLIFGLIGSFVKKGLPKGVSDTLIHAMAICVIYMGISGTLESVPAVGSSDIFSAGLIKVMIMLFSMATGTVIGALIDIEDKINRLGSFIEAKFVTASAEGGSNGNFAKGFVSCTLLFCVGAMAVTGSIEDGMGSPDTILAKTVLDCIVCFVLATTMGIGCAFSAFGLLVYQGTIAVLGFFLEKILPVSTISYMSVVGSLIMILVGTNTLGITKVKTANMIPTTFMPIVLVPLAELIF